MESMGKAKGWTNRRTFCSGAAALLVTQDRVLRAVAQVAAAPAATATRPDVGAIDHDRILAAAEKYLAQKPMPLTSLPCPRSPGTAHDYYSEADPVAEDAAKTSAVVAPFVAHRDAVFELGLLVPALAAAHLLTGNRKYAEQAAVHLRAWFVDAATRMTPRMDFGQVTVAPVKEGSTMRTNTSIGEKIAPDQGGSFEGILETLPLVEIAQSIPFVAASGVLKDAELSAVRAWFAAYLRWLTEAQDSGPRLAALARDRKDHHGTSWLLQVSAYSLLTAPENGGVKSEDKSMVELRHRFRAVTLRAQISADGKFPHELTSATPYRDSLFNLDMLAAICMLLTSRFDSVWEYALEDGPSMRGAIAYHFPFIADRAKWPFRADNEHFTELPGRRASLLFCARAYQRPEYAALWKTLAPDPPSPEVLRTIPIHQPLLWVRQVPRAVEAG